MTRAQKAVMKALFAGGTIAHMGERNIRLRDKDINPLGKVNARTFWKLRELIRKNAKHLWVPNARGIKKQRANSWVRIQYEKVAAQKSSK